MSKIVVTSLGRFNHVNRDGRLTWLFECPGCKQWATMDEDQWAGRVSVDHSSDTCSYHETHNYDAALHAVVVSRLLTGGPVYDEGEEAVRGEAS